MTDQRVVIGGCFIALMILEAVFPLRNRKHLWFRRVMVNLVVSGLAFAAGTFVVRHAAVSVAGWTDGNGFGLLHVLPLPLAGKLVLGFLLMDLTFYWWHRVNHAVPILWRFHNAHHIDSDLDVTTSFRFHFVEILYSAAFRVAQVAVIGVMPVLYIWYEFVFTLATLFHHSNTRLPLGLERVLNTVFVTPRMHGVHHSDIKDEGNSNYSVVFRWWDWIGKSLRIDVPQSALTIGVPAYGEAGDNSVMNSLLMPFRRQREHGRRPDGTRATRDASDLVAGAKSLAE